MNEEKAKLININILKSRNTLDDAKFLIENDKLPIAVNRIYYSIFYMLSALALKKDFETSNHNQLIGWFNKTFIASNKIDISYGKTAIRLFELRNKADYDVYATFTKEQTLELYSGCKNFLDKLEEIINQEI